MASNNQINTELLIKRLGQKEMAILSLESQILELQKELTTLKSQGMFTGDKEDVK